jgi:hypothetical protein
MIALTGEEDLGVDDLQAFAVAKPQNVFQFGSELQKRYSSGPEPGVNLSGLAEAENTITTLHQLSLAIRTASNRNTLTKAPKLTDIDDEFFWIKVRCEGPTDVGIQRLPPVSFDMSQKFEMYIREVLSRRWMTCLPKDDMPVNDRKEMEATATLSDSQREYRRIVFDRCVSLITARRKQLAYFQNHQTKLSANVKAFQSPPVTKDLTARKSEVQLPKPAPTTSASHSAFLPRLADINLLALRVAPSETIGSEFLNTPLTLLPSSINPAPSMAASSAYEIGTDSTTLFGIPPPPELKAFEKEKECPYCRLVYPSQTFNLERSWRWRKHLMQDLQPYPCLFQNCERSAKSCRTFKEWNAHLNQPHYRHWQCPLPHPNPAVSARCPDGFDKLLDFEKHLANDHPNLDVSMAKNAVHLSGQPTDLPQWCFVCLEVQSNGVTEFLKHIERHMRQAYLLALPGRDDIRDSDNVSSGRVATQEGQGLDGEKLDFSKDSVPSETFSISEPKNQDLDSSQPVSQKGALSKDQGKSEDVTKLAEAFEAKILTINMQSGPREAQSHIVLESWTTVQPARDTLLDPNSADPRLSAESNRDTYWPERESPRYLTPEPTLVELGKPPPHLHLTDTVAQLVSESLKKRLLSGSPWESRFTAEYICRFLLERDRYYRRKKTPWAAWDLVLAMTIAKLRLSRNVQYYVNAQPIRKVFQEMRAMANRTDWKVSRFRELRELREPREIIGASKIYDRRWLIVLGGVLGERRRVRLRSQDIIHHYHCADHASGDIASELEDPCCLLARNGKSLSRRYLVLIGVNVASKGCSQGDRTTSPTYIWDGKGSIPPTLVETSILQW